MRQRPGSQASKAAWRRWARAERLGLEFDVLSTALVDRLMVWGGLVGNVLVYAALPDEIDLGALTDIEDIRRLITRTPPDGSLTIHRAGGATELHPFGFRQPVAGTPELDPAEIDVALVPGLAFDIRGVRLGRGGGHFDQLLTRVRPGVARVGIAPAALVVPQLPETERDVRMTHLATEQGVELVAG